METKATSSKAEEKHSHDGSSSGSILEKNNEKKRKGMNMEGYPIEGLLIAGHKTCIILPTLSLAFDIGRCPQRTISQQSSSSLTGGLPMHVATHGLYRIVPPTIIVPTVIKENVEKLFQAHRAMDQSELKHNLIGLNVGEEFYLRKDLKITYTITMPEIAFTGDTMSDFIVDDTNIDVLKAKVLAMESTFVSNIETVENARDYGQTHLSEIVSYADRFQNKAILLIHLSARYQADEIQNAMSILPPSLAD